ncbi:MAG TPA: acyl-ACP thioesterase domain-containing protein [Thermoleophilaceae bacterium]|nr:acyl-ACP thioesterase domain-containing protein [Thermoleophilaceae bacterium]
MELSEIVPVPAVGRIYEETFRVGLADAAPSGRVRMDAIARWVQDLAYADVDDAGVVEQSAWVVRRMRIRAERFPRFGERVDGLTFCSGYARLWAERRVTFTTETGLVDVTGIWVHLNPVSRLPAPLPSSFDDYYAESAQGRKVKARLRHPNPAGDEPSTPWFFRATDADVAAHVNNAVYWEPLEELVAAGPEPEELDAEIEFREPAQPGPAQVLRSENGSLWIAAEDGRIHASLVFPR